MRELELRKGLAYTPEVEAHLSGLPLSDVLVDRERALELRQVWAAARARDMLADAIAEMDRRGDVPEEFERRGDAGKLQVDGGRWRDLCEHEWVWSYCAGREQECALCHATRTVPPPLTRDEARAARHD